VSSTRSPGDELCAIERYVATQTDNLPWLFVSERQAQLPARSTTSFALPVKSRSSVGFGPTCSSIPAATTLRSGNRSADHGGPPRAPRSPNTQPTTPGLPGTVPRGCGGKGDEMGWLGRSRPHARRGKVAVPRAGCPQNLAIGLARVRCRAPPSVLRGTARLLR